MPNIKELYQALDNGRVDDLVSLLTENARYQVGSALPMQGRGEVYTNLSQFVTAVRQMRHSLKQIWEEENTTLVEGFVECTRHDNFVISLPFAAIARYERDLYNDVRVYMDVAPLFAPIN